MTDSVETKAFVKKGAFFQLPMIVVWGIRGGYYAELEGFLSVSFILTVLGSAVMVICMGRIYHNKSKRLLTSDIFALTRHPMYHGMFLMDAALFFSANLSSPLFWFSWLLFVGLLFSAAWFQEKETLARWGEEAQSYYARTPRFIFGWLWR